jgi:ATP-dependent RNA helicase RhlE
MPTDIRQLAHELLREPLEIAVTPIAKTADRVEQRVIFVDGARKRDMLVELFKDAALSRAIVFTRTKRGADKVARTLEEAGVSALAIHGNKSQGQRERALANFRAGKARALVATDIAARGIDIDDVSHVVNFELPEVAEAYVHRIGRTARAGRGGVAISLCEGSERESLRAIERLTRLRIVSTDRRGAKAPEPAKAAHKSEPAPDRPHHAPKGDPRLRKAKGRPQAPSRRSASARRPQRGDRAGLMSANAQRP